MRPPPKPHHAAVVVALLASASAASVAPASAHEPISTAASIALVKQIAKLNAVAGDMRAKERAEAACDLGAKMAFVVQELNRELAQHGELGMNSQVLTKQLKALGVAVSFQPEMKRYRAYLSPLEICVALAPESAKRNAALFRLVRGRFYDSFLYDPLKPIGLTWRRLKAGIAAAERFLSSRPNPTEHEEAAFILAVDYIRATRMAPDDMIARSYAEKARVALTEFVAAYPDSIRVGAAEVLLGVISANK